MLDKLWDDVVARPQPERGLEKLRRKRPSTPKNPLKLILFRFSDNQHCDC
ncbi:dormancy-associated protein 1 [Senna tora]|uniref:Dormancy-associated protein 1 n=1 Tax=Senna tora TaxID=362788 RepID=A0A834SP91_9FABA|nr:dormancy-associated protein 1 [Senna tora]